MKEIKAYEALGELTDKSKLPEDVVKEFDQTNAEVIFEIFFLFFL